VNGKTSEKTEGEMLWRTAVVDGEPTDLVVQRCADCAAVLFPATAERCRNCWSTRLEEGTVPGVGTLYTFTVVHRSYPGLEVPFTVGVVEIAEGLRLTTRVVADAEVRIGDTLRAYARPVMAGSPALSYEFRPVGVQQEAGAA
jgi:uncharacterized OB-fold protein